MSYRSQTIYRLVGALAWAPAVVCINDHLLSFSAIDGFSMKPTFNPDINLLDRDWVLAERWGLSKLKRGDVVIFT